VRAAAIGLLAALFVSDAQAHPWLAPGDEGVRADIQRLADFGVLRGPVTTWPLSWPDIARDVLGADLHSMDRATVDALLRIQRRARLASARGFAGAGIRASASLDPSPLRSFAASPREEAEVALRAGWLSDRFAVSLEGAYVADPDDDRSFRPDGSYVGMNFGNFMLSAGYMERWWGPGWDSSLILSTNARPIPTATLERNYTDPFKSRLLSWIGPWRASIAVGRANDPQASVTGVRFFAARVNFKPRPWLEFGLTRTAQWCGGDRPCDWGTFTDMVVGKDNQTIGGVASDTQPGNQMAGYDIRLRSPWRALPLAFYTQWIGEDEAGGLPAKFIAQFGLETWGSVGDSGWRLRAEFTDTACNFSRERPELGCAYRNSIYPQGYTYRGRVIGAAIDNDSRMYTLAGMLSRSNGDVVSLAVHRIELNRDGGGHAISGVQLDLDSVEFRYSRVLGAGKVTASLGYEDPASHPSSSSGALGFLTWQQGF
jgi:hypothetical protein